MQNIEEIAAGKGYYVINCETFGRRGKIKPAPDSKGYLRFNVTHEGKQFTCWVHRLVAFQKFGGKIYEGNPDVRHMDGNHQNNLPDNIRLGTRSQNLRDTPVHQRSARAVRMNVTKHAELRTKIQGFLDEGLSVRRTAEAVGCSTSAVMTQKNRNQKGR